MLKLFIQFFVLFVLLERISAQNTPPDEIEALQAIYTTMGGDYWINSTNWNEGDPCSLITPWFGITCFNISQTQTSIQSINLPNNNLTNQIPSNITALSNLAFLYMDENEISGNLPDFLFTSNFPLQILILGSNELTGTISEEIGSLAATLTYLDLQQNSLSGSLPNSFYYLNLLTGIQLNGNANYVSDGLSGTISENIGNFTYLQTLHFEQNSFTGTLPDSLWTLSNLTELFLGNNQFQGTISEDIGNLEELLHLQISSTKINGSIPESLYNLTSLQYLNLGLNQLNGTISNSIGNLNQLTQLNLQSVDSVFNENRFYGSVPDSIWNITSLQYLYISFNSLTGTIPTSINKITQLITLDVGQNLMDGTIPDTIFELRSLGTLYLQENQFTGTLNGELFLQLPNLENLLLNSNQLSGVIPTTFFSTYDLSGTTVLSDNPFLCPLPQFATGPPLTASCQYWTVVGAGPQYGSIEGGETITISGSDFTAINANLFCSFSNLTNEISQTNSPAKYIDSSTITCQSPSHPPSSEISHFGITIWFNDTFENQQILTTNPSFTLPIPFVFETVPSIYYINPSSSVQMGGSLINVYGSNFAATDQFNGLFCQFDDQLSGATFVNTTFITCPSANLNKTGSSSFAVTNDNSLNFSNSTNITVYYYEWCDEVNGLTCNGEGSCDNSTTPATCVCNSQYAGEACTDCAEGFYGSVCSACPNCHKGVCQDGKSGNGMCVCNWDYVGADCTIAWFLILIFIIFVVIGCLIFLLVVTIVTRRLRKANEDKRVRIATMIAERRPLVLNEGEGEVKYASTYAKGEYDNNNNNNIDNNHSDEEIRKEPANSTYSDYKSTTDHSQSEQERGIYSSSEAAKDRYKFYDEFDD